MIWYLLLAIFPVVAEVFVNTSYDTSLKNNDKAKKTFLILCGIYIFLMFALRSRFVGSKDPSNYYNNWSFLSSKSIDGIKAYVSNSEMEAGYLYVVGFLSKIFTHPQMLFVLTGAFYSFSVCRFIFKNSNEPTISVVMFITLGLYTFMTQAIRQAIAMCICLFAIELCKSRKFFKFLILILVAMTFHNSAIFFLFAYFLYNIKINPLTFITIAIISGGVLVLSPRIIQYANVLYGSEFSRVVDSGGFVALAIYVIIICAAILFYEIVEDKNTFNFFFYLTYVGGVVFSMRYIGGLIAGRVSNYYMFGQIILLPNLIAKMDEKTSFGVKFITILLCVLLFAYRLKDSDLIPFKFFWQVM